MRSALKSALAARGWTRKELAYAAGLKPSQLSNIERGRRCLRVSIAIAWSHLLSCDPAPLVRAVLQDQVSAAGGRFVVIVAAAEPEATVLQEAKSA